MDDGENDKTAVLKTLLDHYQKSWSAEEENASRLHRERQVAITILLAVFAALFAGAIKLLPNCHGWGFWLAVAPLGIALLFFFDAFYRLAPTKPAKKTDDSAPNAPCATHHLCLPEEMIEAGGSEDYNLKSCYLAFYNAFLDLQQRNDDTLGRVRAGSGSLSGGIIIGVIGLILALLTQPSISDVELVPKGVEQNVTGIQQHRHEHYHYLQESEKRSGVESGVAGTGSPESDSSDPIPPRLGTPIQ